VSLGIADHLGRAIAVTATSDHEVVDRRRIELIEPGVPTAPVEHEAQHLAAAAATALVAHVRASVDRAASAALDELANALPAPLVSISLRAWPAEFPEDIAVQRRAPYQARADAIMYRQALSELAYARGWDVHLYDAKAVVGQAVRILDHRADQILHGPRATIGPPWAREPSGRARGHDRRQRFVRERSGAAPNRYLAASPRAARAERTWLMMISMMMAIENQSP
jgi:hypothetical protein